MRGFGGSSNFPPGHPTGVMQGEPGEVFTHPGGNCLMLLEKSDLVKVTYPVKLKSGSNQRVTIQVCGYCGEPVVPATCEQCGDTATHIDVDRSVNAAEAFCGKHYMGWRDPEGPQKALLARLHAGASRYLEASSGDDAVKAMKDLLNIVGAELVALRHRLKS